MKNDLGTIEIYLPPELDSSYQWISYTDFAPCGHEYRYRFIDKRYSALAETGFIYLKQPDSLYQFTIFHMQDKNCIQNFNLNKKKLSGIINKISDHNKAFQKEGHLIWEEKSIKEIEGRKYLLLAYTDKSDYIMLDEMAKVLIFTKIGKEVVWLEFECNACDCSDFTKRMRPAIETIRIDTSRIVGKN
ncbi:hypothetical protein QNI19_23485 [Cytophagaceae bacterium DM2B3-1]|uniref:DUF3805 domain-containing protein n=1 Tax=Xanthocytophaga flava TaxID=3048013 RepID=A0ABT7CQ94_9BACT|nr:hypothetical protein [Xanthocytophaga flavus]MDJ1495917.1 hypothetical protein [Xanthocytophaga flavus]